MAEIVEIEIVMDDGSIRKGFGKVQGAGQDAADAINKSFKTMTGLITTAVTALAGAFAVGKIVEAGVESEKAWRGFALALASTGQFTDDVTKKFEAYAESLQKVTGVQDEVIASGAAMLLNVGRLSSTELPRVTKAALDLAAAMPQIGGPEGAFNLLAKAAAGSTSALGRYGIHVDDTLKKSEKFAAVIKLIETNFNGMAEANKKTFAGMQAFAELGFGEIVKQMGLLVTRSPVLINLLKVLGDMFFDIAKKIGNLFGGKDPFKPIIASIITFGKNFTYYILQPLELVGNVGKVFFKDFLAGLSAIVALAGFAASGIVMLLETIGVDVSKKIVDDINSVTDQAAQKVIDFTTSAEESMMTLDQTTMSTGISDFLNNMDAVVAKSSEMQTSYTNSVNNMKGSTAAFVDESVLKMKQLNEAVTRTIVQGISGAVQSMVRNLHQGKNAFDNFGNMILGLIGDVAIQIGEFFLLTGIGLIALISNPITAGFTTVAMGLALIAFGALMKSMSGGQGSMPGGGGGGVDTGGGVATPESTSEPETEAVKPKTDVTVVVQGNVFDRRETGLYIAEIINDNFDINGTKLETGAV